jgi:hypothetical protein
MNPRRITLSIQIDHYDDPSLPKDARFVGIIMQRQYKGIVESGSSVRDVLCQLGDAIVTRELYFKSSRLKGKTVKPKKPPLK